MMKEKLKMQGWQRVFIDWVFEGAARRAFRAEGWSPHLPPFLVVEKSNLG